MFHVHRSNRSEALADALAELVRDPAGGALDSEIVVVQSRGMERWLSLAIAQRLGVAAALEFPFPRAFVERVLGLSHPSAPELGAFNRERLTWAIAAELELDGEHRRDPEVSRYLSDDPMGLKRYELSAQLAQVFDQYAVFRPEMVLEWDAGTGSDFQPALWRRVVARLGGHHVAERVQRLRAEGVDKTRLLSRVSIFGVSALPPLYLDVFHAISSHVDVHLFQHSPSDMYWSALRSEKGEQETLAELGLLATLGRQGAELAELLEARVQYQEHARYQEPVGTTALAHLQRDLMHVRRPASGRARSLSAADTSIEVAVCHSATRELQVLADRIWGWLHADASLEPHDILVMVPDVDAYCPHIEAVFGRELSERDLIPYRIADRAERRANPVAEAVLGMLSLAEGRLSASACLDLLQLAPVRARFDITAEELPLITELVSDAGIRWGRDAEHRERSGQPPAEENTWRFGIARLLLGYCMPTGGRAAFGGVLPLDDIEGERALLAGKLAAFAESLFRVVGELTGEKTLAEWRDCVLRCTADLLLEDDNNFTDSQVVRRALSALSGDASGVEFHGAVHREVLRVALEARLVEERRVREFMAGGVTFAAMLPMRSIPFRVICLLGMNDDAFPRADLVRTFDKIAAARRLGDRSLRDEDRYLFLEALLSARDCLYLSYVGRDIQDNSVRPPSVVVEELLDVLQADDRFVVGDTTEPQQQLFSKTCGAREHVVIEHSLSAHAPRYFSAEDPRFYSYSEVFAAGARALIEPKLERPNPMLGARDATAQAAVDLGELCRFFDNPPRYLAERHLGIRLRREAVRVEDREPIEPTALDGYFAGTFLLEHLVFGDEPKQIESLLRAQGALPVGELGRQHFLELLAECVPLCQATAELTRQRRPPVEVQVETPEGALTGVVDSLFESGQVHYGYGRVKGRRRLRLWLRHLALCAAGSADPSFLIARGSPQVFIARHPVLAPEQAAQILGALIALFRAGVERPLPFVPEASFAYAERRLRLGNAAQAHEKALETAKSAYLDRYNFGESQDEYVQLAFPGEGIFVESSPGTPGFTELAWEVFAPMLDHTEVGA